jgi:pyridoxine/pyridoxamine 5'-phosphate oxidase
MDKTLLYQFLARHELGVLSTTGPSGEPQSALVGIATTPSLEIIFDTVQKSRKSANLARDQRAAFVVGWEGEITVQFEGLARQISSKELGPYHEVYFRQYPDGRERLKWEGIQYFVVAPKWIRYTNYDVGREIIEFRFP